MKWFKRFVLVVFAVALLLVLSVSAVQTWYRFTPTELSAEAKTLSERSAKLPTVTDNGYRLYGIEAPREQDAVAFGRCLVDAHWAHLKDEASRGEAVPALNGLADKAAYDAYWSARSLRLEERNRECGRGAPLLKMPKAFDDVKLNLSTTRGELARISALDFDPLLLGRAEQVWAGDARRVGASFDAPFAISTVLVATERWRIARAAVAWDSGDRSGATTAWGNSIRNWVKSADDTLIDSMVSTNVLTQMLIVMQQSVAQVSTLDEPSMKSLLVALAPVEAMPHAVADTLLAEWQLAGSVLDAVEREGVNFSVSTPGPVERVSNSALLAALDRNDTLNLMAKTNLWSQRAVLEAAQGAPTAKKLPEWTEFPCESLGVLLAPCSAFTRNPIGRVLAVVALPMYESYGVRVADLMTLLNATRLTIRARHLGLTGAALEKFVADAPPDMRDISTKQPFRYDARERKLYVELRTRSTVLGDKGTYTLPL